MSILHYSRYRRLKLRDAWELAGMAAWCKQVGGYLLGLLIALACVSYITDAATAADEAQEDAQRSERLQAYMEAALLSCLNNKGIWLDGRLYTCSIGDTHLTQEDFK